MSVRLVAAALAALVTLAGSTSAAAQGPLAGTGQNVEPIANHPIGEGQKNEIELAGDHAYVSFDGGLAIVNISDPLQPTIDGLWECQAGWGDVDLSPDANIAVLTNAHGGECFDADDDTAVAIVDVSDKRNPKTLSRIPLDDEVEYVHTSTLDNKLLYLNPQVWAGYPQANSHIAIYDISDPSTPERKGFIEFEQGGQPVPAAAHDSYIDHRPDGKSLLYAASIHTTDVFDVTDPFAATHLQRVTSPEVTISHDAQPNFKRDIIVLADETAGSACGRAGGPGPGAYDAGSVHFYAAAPNGTFANNAAAELGSWNVPPQPSPETCTAHVFWQAPDENRLTIAWYSGGARILDFSDPANVRELGWFKARPSTMYWSAKPHRGYLFATDMDRGLDVLRYTGEEGTRWPATAGPADIQRAARQGVPYVPPGGEPPAAPAEETRPLPPPSGSASRSVGRFRFTARTRRVLGPRGKKKRLVIAFRNSAGKQVAAVRFRRQAGRRAKARLAGVAETGTYRWTIKAGRRTLARGRLTVREEPGLTLSPGTSMAFGRYSGR